MKMIVANTIDGTRGFALIESLVAVVMLSLTIVAVSKLHIYTLYTGNAIRDYSTLTGDVRAAMDSYRNLDFGTLLTKFNSIHSNIAHGTTVTESNASLDRNINYSTVLTAVRSASHGAPEAVSVRISVTDRRGKLGTKVFNYESLIAETG